MPNFYSALVQAIRTARWQGQTDGPGEDVLTLTWMAWSGRHQGARASTGAPFLWVARWTADERPVQGRYILLRL